MSGSEDNSLRLWEITTGECLRKLDGHMDTITSIIWKVLLCSILRVLNIIAIDALTCLQLRNNTFRKTVKKIIEIPKGMPKFQAAANTKKTK